jgi:hypothetical protein
MEELIWHETKKLLAWPYCKTGLLQGFTLPLTPSGGPGGVVVSVLASGPNGRGFQPCQGDGF